jgi:hypothetical protein
MKLRACFVVVTFLCAVVVSTPAQTAAPNSSLVSTQIPRLIKFSGVAQNETRKPVTGVVGVTFSLYKDQQVAVRCGPRRRTCEPTRLDTTQ